MQLLIIENQPANYKVVFLSEERLFSLTGDLKKTIFAAFITRLVRHPEKTKLNSKTAVYCPSEYSKFFETSCMLQFQCPIGKVIKVRNDKPNITHSSSSTGRS